MLGRFEGIVRQDSYASSPEDTYKPVRLNPRGEMIVPDWMTQLALDGRVFNSSTPVQETALNLNTTARGTDNISPAILLDVPAGTTVIPLEVIMAAIAGTAEDVTVTINTDDGTRFSTGGTSRSIVNARKDDPGGSLCTFYTEPTAIANVDDDTIWAKLIDGGQIATPTTDNPAVFWSAKFFTPPILIGPASLLIFVTSTTDDHTWQYSVKWAEMPTTDIT